MRILCSIAAIYGCAIVLTVASGCGHKTDIRPPEFVAPEGVGDLALSIEKEGVRLRWSRPLHYADGSDMDDLGAFVVMRASRDSAETRTFERIAIVPVEDRERFQQTKKFVYTDVGLTSGTFYRYRVFAVTLDGYQGNNSNTVELVWRDDRTQD